MNLGYLQPHAAAVNTGKAAAAGILKFGHTPRDVEAYRMIATAAITTAATATKIITKATTGNDGKKENRTVMDCWLLQRLTLGVVTVLKSTSQSSSTSWQVVNGNSLTV